MTNKTLSEQAKDIIEQPALNIEDIKNLCKIRFKMSLQYNEAKQLAGRMESAYNKGRPEKYISFKEQAKKKGNKYTETEFTEAAKLHAESEYGTRREVKAKCNGFMAVMQSIEAVCMAFYVENKSIDKAIQAWVED